MDQWLARIRAIGPVFIDGWLVVGRDGTVLDHNAHYRALFPRHQARKLNGSRCCQFLELSACAAEGCLTKRCLAEGPVRLDELPATLVEADKEPGGEEKRVIVSAVPLAEEGEAPEAVLFLIRDVTAEAKMQRRYKASEGQAEREKERLEKVIQRKTKELMDANMLLNRIQKELIGFKKGLFG